MTCVRCGSQLRGDSPCPRCLLNEQSPTFAGLELLEPLGEGGMGTVFRARHVKLDRFVAVKVLSREVAAVAELKERFTLEARSLAKVKHPNVVQVFDAGEEDGEAFLVMELVEGGTLASRLPLEPREAVRVTSAVCRALQAVHDAGLVHRDVKPENVLLTASGEVKLSDFGIVGEAAATRAGAPVGTPGFVAPEVLAGRPATPRADVFAVGVMLRQLVTGLAPGSTPEPAIPGGLDAIVRRATSAAPEARFESAREFESALSQVTLEEAGALPAEEQLCRAVAVSMTVAFASIAWAAVASLTPRVHAVGDVPPLVALGTRTLESGRLYTVARFETGWVLAAAALFGVALAAVGALRQHWRRLGLTTARPAGRLPFARATFFTGAVALSLYLARLAWVGPHASLSPYIPIVGGSCVLAVAYFASLARLEAWRLGRSVVREPEWVLGVIAGALPPVVDGLRQMVERAVP